MNQAKPDSSDLKFAPDVDPGDEDSGPGIVDGLIRPLAHTLWLYRRTITAVAFLGVLLSVGLTTFFFLAAKIEQVASVPFRFQFNGAASGQYPNERAFSESDVIAPAVVSAVYERNELSRWMPLEKLENGLFVLRTSLEAELLTYEYRARLNEARLIPPERVRLELEFKNRLDSAPSQYALMFMASGAVTLPPDVVMEKTLADLLATWATQAVEQHGVLEPEAELPTPATLSNIDSDEDDVLRRIDVLHGKILRLIEDIVEFEKRFGTASRRGSRLAIGLPEIRTGLDDVLRYELEPLYLKAIAGGLPEPGTAVQFLESRLRQLQSEVREAVGKRDLLIEGYRLYSDKSEIGVAAANGPPGNNGGQPGAAQLITTPLSEPFLDRLLSMNRRAEDGQFRQALVKQISQASASIVSLQKNEQLYHNLLALTSSPRRPVTGASVTRQVAASLDRVQKKAVAALEQAREVAIATPRGSMYSYTGGFTFTRLRAVSLVNVAVAGLAITTIMILLTAAGCLFHYGYARTPRVLATESASQS